jgi:iron complex transport system ATP-binding protein
MADPALVVERLSVVRGRRPVLQDLSFTAGAGSITVLLGPNGAGKSTALKCILGLLPYDGEVTLGGRPAAALEPRARARLVAYVPQHSSLDAPLPVRDVVAQGRFAHEGDNPFARPSSSERAAVETALSRTDLQPLADRTFTTLSYGERRRVLLARALATHAPVLLLDEPTAALDVGHALQLLVTLREIARGGTAVVMVLHQLQEAAAVADQAVLLAAGRTMGKGAVAEVIAPGPVRAVYGVQMIPGGQFACRLPEHGTEDRGDGGPPR